MRNLGDRRSAIEYIIIEGFYIHAALDLVPPVFIAWRAPFRIACPIFELPDQFVKGDVRLLRALLLLRYAAVSAACCLLLAVADSLLFRRLWMPFLLLPILGSNGRR